MLKLERYFKSPGSVDAFQVVNTPVFIRKNRDTTWDAYALMKPCNTEFTIVSGTAKKGTAVEAASKYLDNIKWGYG